MPDIDYGEVFGVEVPEEPEQETEEEQGGEPAEETPPQDDGEPGEPEENAESELPADEFREQEDGARYVEIRHQAEREARSRAEQEIGALLASSGLSDPYTRQPIASLQDLKAYRERYEQDRRREFQEGHNMDDQAYQAFVSELPEVKAAREAAEKTAAEGAKARLERDLQEVRRLDPAVKGLEELAQRAEYPQLCGLVEKGLSLPEAYKLVYFDQFTQKAAEATRQAALNSVNSKQHLSQTETRGEGALPVPSDVAAEYRVFMPDATDAEIQKHYNSYARAHRD